MYSFGSDNVLEVNYPMNVLFSFGAGFTDSAGYRIPADGHFFYDVSVFLWRFYSDFKLEPLAVQDITRRQTRMYHILSNSP